MPRTEFALDVYVGLYAPLFMFEGRAVVRCDDGERLYTATLPTRFRNRLAPGLFPHPAWHDDIERGACKPARRRGALHPKYGRSDLVETAPDGQSGRCHASGVAAMIATSVHLRCRLLAALLTATTTINGAVAHGDEPGSSDGAGRPVLLELFTSQGCSSCPPADAVQRALADRYDVLALGFHVDYWDDLGWVDPFSSPAFSARQQAYARQHGFQVYTPQLVVDGAVALVGSRRARAEAAIVVAAARRQTAAATIRRDGSRLQLSIGQIGDSSAAGEVWLISFDREQVTTIRSGENAGKRIVYPNVVRSIRKLADWSNVPLQLDERLAADERGERLALLVQARDGQVWAVAATD